MTHLEPEELSLGESDRIPGRPIFGYDSLFDLETGRGGEIGQASFFGGNRRPQKAC